MPEHRRVSKDEYYLNIARVVSTRSTCLRRMYGAIVVKNDEIIATGYNGAARGESNCCDVFDVCPRSHMAHNSGDYSACPAVHAEQNAMISAKRSDTLGATLYLIGQEDAGDGTLRDIPVCEPCPVCARMLKNAGIARIVGPQDLKHGTGDAMVAPPGIHGNLKPFRAVFSRTGTATVMATDEKQAGELADKLPASMVEWDDDFVRTDFIGEDD